jgi:MFS transporter, Spinster family, sphingosine-1-phosphate transporter
LAPTIIGDLFSSEKRSNILTVFYLAIPFGTGLSFVLGSKISEAFGEWQWALLMTPPLSIVGALCIIFLVQEPERGGFEGKILNENRTNIFNEIVHLFKK